VPSRRRMSSASLRPSQPQRWLRVTGNGPLPVVPYTGTTAYEWSESARRPHGVGTAWAPRQHLPSWRMPPRRRPRSRPTLGSLSGRCRGCRSAAR
jgi:hypothetical protein